MRLLSDSVSQISVLSLNELIVFKSQIICTFYHEGNYKGKYIFTAEVRSTFIYFLMLIGFLGETSSSMQITELKTKTDILPMTYLRETDKLHQTKREHYSENQI